MVLHGAQPVLSSRKTDALRFAAAVRGGRFFFAVLLSHGSDFWSREPLSTTQLIGAAL